MKSEKTAKADDMQPITKTTPNDGAEATTDLESARAEAFAQMTPYERYKSLLEERQLAIAERQLSESQATRRLGENSELRVAEHVRRVDEARDARAERCRSGRVSIVIPHTMTECSSEIVEIPACMIVNDRGDGVAVPQSLTGFVFTESDAVLGVSIEREFGDEKLEAAREHDEVRLQNFEKLLNSKGPRGLRGRRWQEVTKPIIRNLIGRGSLDDLVAQNKVRLTGEIVWDERRDMINGKLVP